MLSWTWGQFHLDPEPLQPATPSFIDVNCWEQLILEAARQRDEQNDDDEEILPQPSQQQLAELLASYPALAGAAIVGATMAGSWLQSNWLIR
ncbi:MAG: DUF4388 domain-containing protein [Chloroflexales bacterium]|nr:DUF4388 domain-containing protein [Chloroflexales bacterium]